MSCLVKYSVNVFFIIWRIFVPVNLRPLNRVRLSDFDSNTNIIKKSSPLSIKKNQKVKKKYHPIHSVSVLLYFQLAISVSICILFVIYHHMYYIVSNGEDISKFHSLYPILLLFHDYKIYLN